MAMITHIQMFVFEPNIPLLQQGSQQPQLLLQESYIVFTSASAIVYTGVCVLAVIVIHKQKNNEDDEPQNCTAFATIFVSYKIEHTISSFHYLHTFWLSQQPKSNKNTKIKKSIPSLEPKREEQHLLPSIKKHLRFFVSIYHMPM